MSLSRFACCSATASVSAVCSGGAGLAVCAMGDNGLMRQGECWVSPRDAGAVIRQGSTVLFEVTECAARILCPRHSAHAYLRGQASPQNACAGCRWTSVLHRVLGSSSCQHLQSCFEQPFISLLDMCMSAIHEQGTQPFTAQLPTVHGKNPAGCATRAASSS